jgi:DNA segregation ATPase FtsK/SpoIIIE, S-DNA-T family
MTSLKSLEKRVNDLEVRLKQLEGDTVYMDQLYQKAKELVVKYNKASIIFLQRKLLIDFERASRLMQKLESDGVLGQTSLKK